LRRSLGIGADQGPVLLLAGDGRDARHDHGLWAAAIVRQMFPRAVAVVREDPRGRQDVGVERFRHALPEEEVLVEAPGELGWKTLVHAADVVVASPDGRGALMGTGAILAAMAAGVPVLGTPVPVVTDLIAQGETGLVAKGVQPRMIAARLEEFMADSTLRYPLVDRARAAVYGRHSPSAMVETVLGMYAAAEGQRSARQAEEIGTAQPAGAV
jgi:glycosyltransferase involved in cell wall biosynthesis